MNIPFMKPPFTGNEISVITSAINGGHHGGDGPFTKKVQEFIELEFGVGKCLLTTSCTDALEMSALLIEPTLGDEIILPSYTFSSTANAFAMHGFTPVFVDVDEQTKNITVENIEAAITRKTKAIVVVHYAGIICDMDPIMELASKFNLVVIEDAAQAVNSKYKGRYAGSIGHLGTYSFHATKSYSCGEGGALLMNDEKFFRRSQFLWEKGTDRSLVLAGVKNKYSWVDYGSSFLISDILASLLYDQLSNKDFLQEERRRLHNTYTEIMLRVDSQIQFLTVPEYCQPNYHAFWLEVTSAKERETILHMLRELNVIGYIGYVPLHSSPMGKKVCKVIGKMDVTEKSGECLIRLPFYIMSDSEIKYVTQTLESIFLKN